MQTIHNVAHSVIGAVRFVLSKFVPTSWTEHKAVQEATYSPDVPADLLSWLPDLDRLPLDLLSNHCDPNPVDFERHYVWLMDSTAWRSPTSPDDWQVEIEAAYFVKDSGMALAKVIAGLCLQCGIELDSQQRAVVEKRVKPFVDVILPHRTVDVTLDDSTPVKIGPSSTQGISSNVLTLSADVADDTMPYTFAITSEHTSSLTGHIAYTEPIGWAVISDVDDTIKITQTPSPVGILQTTFFDAPSPVPDMPPLYAHLSEILRPAFFYLSASPYNLYPFLHAFIADNYPHGSIILRDASWQNLGGLISSLTQNVQTYKVSQMKTLLARFPHKRVVFIGDSTQKDPESYGEIARLTKGTGWVGAIFIRRVVLSSGNDDTNEKVRNSDKRFEKAFKGIDRSVWHVFDDPAEVKARIDALVAK